MQVKAEGIITSFGAMFSGVLGVITGNFFLFSVLPSACGSFFSARMRFHGGKLKRKDIGFALISALVFGLIVGRWLGGLMPGQGDAIAVFCFFMSMLATSSLESLNDVEWDIGAWLLSILDGLLTVFKK